MEDRTILNKMIKEIQLAKESEHNRQKFMKHINHIKLLCELFLEEDVKEEQLTQRLTPVAFTEQEMKAMLGEKKSTMLEKKSSSLLDHDDANGDSIFDF